MSFAGISRQIGGQVTGGTLGQASASGRGRVSPVLVLERTVPKRSHAAVRAVNAGHKHRSDHHPMVGTGHPRLGPHPGDQHLTASPIGLQVHRLDHRVLDAKQPPPYPRSAHDVPIMIVSSFGRPETLDRARRAPLPIMNSHPVERQ